MYVADGFGKNINHQINGIKDESQVSGSVIPARNLLRLLQKHITRPVDHKRLQQMIMCNSKIELKDIELL